MRALLLSMSALLLSFLITAPSLAAECGDPPYEGHCVIDNGAAPPTAENVLDDATYSANAVWVRNGGCPPGWPAVAPETACPSPGAATSAEMVAGAEVGYVIAHDGSEAVISGGQANFGVVAYGSSSIRVTGGLTVGSIEAHDSAQVRVYGGSSDGILGYGSATLSFHDGVTGGIVGADSSRIHISGGSFQSLQANGSSTVTLGSGALVGDFASIATGTGLLEIAGGAVSSGLAVRDSAEIIVTGGYVTGSVGAIEPTATITIVGRDFIVNGAPASAGIIPGDFGTLTGRLQSGGSIVSTFGHNGHTSPSADEICYQVPCYGVIRLVEATPLPALSPAGQLALVTSLLLSAWAGARFARRRA